MGYIHASHILNKIRTSTQIHAQLFGGRTCRAALIIIITLICRFVTARRAHSAASLRILPHTLVRVYNMYVYVILLLLLSAFVVVIVCYYCFWRLYVLYTIALSLVRAPSSAHLKTQNISTNSMPRHAMSHSYLARCDFAILRF